MKTQKENSKELSKKIPYDAEIRFEPFECPRAGP